MNEAFSTSSWPIEGKLLPPVGKKVYRGLLGALPDRLALQVSSLRAHRKLARLDRPVTFSDKIQFRKLFDRDPRLPCFADKIKVKDHVSELLGQTWIIPTIWFGRQLPARIERKWTVPYVIKANHASGWNYFVRNFADQNWDRIESSTCEWLQKRYAAEAREWVYKDIEPQLLVEEYVGMPDGTLPLDYKFFVFGGRVHYIQVDTGRASNHRRCFYDRNWIKQPFTLLYPLEPADIPRPNTLNEMIRAAECLAADFPFVRVDLYEIKGKPMFGEMTFYPGSGTEVFRPTVYDETFGALWPQVA